MLGNGTRIVSSLVVLAFLMMLIGPLGGVQAAGMMPDGPPEKSIYGYVKDNSGTAIVGATVYNPTLGTRTTNANGAYAYEDVSYGTYVIQASKFEYWTEKANTTITYPQIVKRQDFQLPNDVNTSYQPLIAVFSTVDTAKVDTRLYFEASSGAQATIYDYAAGSGFDYTVSIQTYEWGEEFDKPSLIYGKQTRITGWFWATQSGECMNAYGVQSYSIYDQSNTAVDSLDPGTVPLETRVLSPGSIHGIGVSQTGSTTIQSGVAMTINVGILGNGFSTAFEAGLAVTSLDTLTIEIEFKNTDTTSRTFYFYKEGNIVLHLWDEDNI